MALRQFVVQDVKIEIDAAMLNPQLESALTRGAYEGAESNAMKHLLAADDVFFELGAGVGFLSTLAFRVLKKPKQVLAFEANPEMIPVIEATWRANGASGQLANCMLGNGKGEREFNVSKAFWASSAQIDYGGARKIKVPQRDFLKQLEKHSASFLMMDIEGGEGELLDKTLPPCVRKLVAEFHPGIIGDDKVSALVTNLLGQGFHLALDACRGKVLAFQRG